MKDQMEMVKLMETQEMTKQKKTIVLILLFRLPRAKGRLCLRHELLINCLKMMEKRIMIMMMMEIKI